MLEPWENRAACTGHDPRLWNGDDAYFNQRAKEICFTCPVIDRCLIDAMVNKEEGAIWGGHTPEERHEIRPAFLERHRGNMHLLMDQYRRKRITMGSRQERRLEKSRTARRSIPVAHPKYDDYLEVLDLVIGRPTATAEELGRRIGKSGSYIQHTLCEAWEIAS